MPAEAAGLSPDVLRMEIDRARKRLLRQEKREETRREMDPAAAVQPFQRELRYDNVRSAVAEEGLLRMLFREPALLAQTEGLTAEDFSVPLFGRVYAALRERWQNDLAITPAALAGQPEPGGNGASDGRAAEAGAAAVRNGAGGLPAHPA